MWLGCDRIRNNLCADITIHMFYIACRANSWGLVLWVDWASQQMGKKNTRLPRAIGDNCCCHSTVLY